MDIGKMCGFIAYTLLIMVLASCVDENTGIAPEDGIILMDGFVTRSVQQGEYNFYFIVNEPSNATFRKNNFLEKAFINCIIAPSKFFSNKDDDTLHANYNHIRS